MARAPSVKAIIKADQIALFSVVGAPVCLVLAGLAVAGWLPEFEAFSLEPPSFVSPEQAPMFFALAMVALVAGGATLAWRVGKVRSVFASGGTSHGIITRFTRFKDRGYLHYRFGVLGGDVEARHFVHLAAHVKRLEVGQAVTVRFDPAHPSRAFVAELFSE